MLKRLVLAVVFGMVPASAFAADCASVASAGRSDGYAQTRIGLASIREAADESGLPADSKEYAAKYMEMVGCYMRGHQDGVREARIAIANIQRFIQSQLANMAPQSHAAQQLLAKLNALNARSASFGANPPRNGNTAAKGPAGRQTDPDEQGVGVSR